MAANTAASGSGSGEKRSVRLSASQKQWFDTVAELKPDWNVDEIYRFCKQNNFDGPKLQQTLDSAFEFDKTSREDPWQTGKHKPRTKGERTPAPSQISEERRVNNGGGGGNRNAGRQDRRRDNKTANSRGNVAGVGKSGVSKGTQDGRPPKGKSRNRADTSDQSTMPSYAEAQESVVRQLQTQSFTESSSIVNDSSAHLSAVDAHFTTQHKTSAWSVKGSFASAVRNGLVRHTVPVTPAAQQSDSTAFSAHDQEQLEQAHAHAMFSNSDEQSISSSLEATSLGDLGISTAFPQPQGVWRQKNLDDAVAATEQHVQHIPIDVSGEQMSAKNAYASIAEPEAVSSVKESIIHESEVDVVSPETQQSHPESVSVQPEHPISREDHLPQQKSHQQGSLYSSAYVPQQPQAPLIVSELLGDGEPVILPQHIQQTGTQLSGFQFGSFGLNAARPQALSASDASSQIQQSESLQRRVSPRLSPHEQVQQPAASQPLATSQQHSLSDPSTASSNRFSGDDSLGQLLPEPQPPTSQLQREAPTPIVAEQSQQSYDSQSLHQLSEQTPERTTGMYGQQPYEQEHQQYAYQQAYDQYSGQYQDVSFGYNTGDQIDPQMFFPQFNAFDQFQRGGQHQFKGGDKKFSTPASVELQNASSQRHPVSVQKLGRVAQSNYEQMRSQQQPGIPHQQRYSGQSFYNQSYQPHLQQHLQPLQTGFSKAQFVADAKPGVQQQQHVPIATSGQPRANVNTFAPQQSFGQQQVGQSPQQQQQIYNSQFQQQAAIYNQPFTGYGYPNINQYAYPRGYPPPGFQQFAYPPGQYFSYPGPVSPNTAFDEYNSAHRSDASLVVQQQDVSNASHEQHPSSAAYSGAHAEQYSAKFQQQQQQHAQQQPSFPGIHASHIPSASSTAAYYQQQQQQMPQNYFSRAFLNGAVNDSRSR